MPLLSAEPRVTRSSRSAVAESSCAAGTTALTSPQSSAVRASMTSPDRAISMARFRPTLRAIATIGVWYLLDERHQLGAGDQQRPDRRKVSLDDVGEVVTGAEHRPVPGQDDAQRVAVPDLPERRDQLAHVVQRQRVTAPRPVHRDGGELARPLD